MGAGKSWGNRDLERLMEMLLTKRDGAFLPYDDEAREYFDRLQVGAVVKCDVKQMRNWKFFRKWFSLVRLAFGIWDERAAPMVHEGVEVRRDFEKFRKDVVIMCGMFRYVAGPAGVSPEAESISWAEMDEDRFETLYSTTIDVILGKVLDKDWTCREALDEAVNSVLGYC